MNKIGIVVLLGGEILNRVRNIEFDAAQISNNWRAFYQPPHITIKRPFMVSSSEQLEAILDKLSDSCRDMEPFDVTFGPVDKFGDKTIFQSVLESSKLKRIHLNMLALLDSLNINYATDFEGEHFRPHTTIATMLSQDQFHSVFNYLSNNDQLDGTSVTVSKLALMLNIDEEHWVVLQELAIGTND